MEAERRESAVRTGCPRFKRVIFKGLADQVEASDVAERPADEIPDEGHPWTGDEFDASRVVELIGKRCGAEAGNAASDITACRCVTDVDVLTQSAAFG